MFVLSGISVLGLEFPAIVFLLGMASMLFPALLGALFTRHKLIVAVLFCIYLVVLGVANTVPAMAYDQCQQQLTEYASKSSLQPNTYFPCVVELDAKSLGFLLLLLVPSFIAGAIIDLLLKRRRSRSKQNASSIDLKTEGAPTND